MTDNPSFKELVKKSLEIAKNAEPMKFEKVIRPAKKYPFNLSNGHQVTK